MAGSLRDLQHAAAVVRSASAVTLAPVALLAWAAAPAVVGLISVQRRDVV